MTPENEESAEVLVENPYWTSAQKHRPVGESSNLTGTVFDALEVRLIESDQKLSALYRDVLKKTLEAKKLNAEQTIRAMKEQENLIRAKQRAEGIQHGENTTQHVEEF